MKSILIFVSICIIQLSSLLAESDKYRLVYRDDPSTSIVVCWDNLSGNNHRVYYDIVDHGQDTSAYSFIKTPDRVEDVKGMVNTFARLSGLTPDTKYYFLIADDDFISSRYWFQTIPNDPSVRLSLIFGGDSRSNQSKRQNANKMVAKLRAHAVIFGGDYVDDGTNEQWEQWFNDWQLTVSDDGRFTPLVATQGNHELIWTNFPAGNDVVDKLFDTPGSEHYFALSFGGSLIRTYSLDAEYPVATSYGAQTDWFENDLIQQASNHIWLAAQYHSPVRPHNADKIEGNKQYNEWVPLFDEYDFAFAHENDAHLCKQTWPIRMSSNSESEEGFIRDDYNGTVYIGEGGWGAPLRDNDDNKEWTRNSAKVYQIKWIFVNQDTIEIRTVLTDNVDNVIPHQEGDNIFSIPQGIELWTPDNGELIIIQKWSVPECEIIIPEDGEYFENPQPINIQVNASDPHGIQQVEFFVNGSSEGVADNEPFQMNYQIPYEGMFYLSAKATNNQGIESPMSDVVSVGCGELNNTITIVTNDDAEENLNNGSVDLESGDLELIRESGWMGINEFDQVVGMRFANINIPIGAIISSAYIQFKVDDTNNKNPCELSIYGQAIDNAPVFADSDFNITNRELTSAVVNWSPPDWNVNSAQGPNQQTPDISSIIYEIVNRPGWAQFNDIAIIISGEGRRTASAGNAELHIEYTVNIAPQIEIIEPANQTVFSSLEEITIEAQAFDLDGEIVSVTFIVNDEEIGLVYDEPFQIEYTLPEYQTYDIYAIAVDNLGFETVSNHVSVKATTPPTTELIVPGSDTIVNGLPTILLRAIADDEYGDIELVEFYTTNNNLIGSDDLPPYECLWTVPFYGTFELKAVAIDDDGLSTTSDTRMLTAEINSLTQTENSSEIKVYPNPVSDILTIELSNEIGRDKPLIVLYDINQKVLMQQSVKASSDLKIRIDMKKFSQGSYLLQVKGDGYNCLQKIVVL
jgi:hypothetical protein